MTTGEANQIMENGINEAITYLQIGKRAEKGTPLFEEMRQAAIDSLSWIFDDDVIDALYEDLYEEDMSYD